MKTIPLMLSMVLSTGLLAQSENNWRNRVEALQSGPGVMHLSVGAGWLDDLDLDYELGDQLKMLEGKAETASITLLTEPSKPAERLHGLAAGLKKAGLTPLPIPSDTKEEPDLLAAYGELTRSPGRDGVRRYRHLILILLSDDGETGVILHLEGQFKTRPS